MKQYRKIGDICTVISGTTPKSNKAEYWNGNCVWITPAEISEDSVYISDSERHITDIAVKESSLKSFPKGTVILSSRAPIGKVAIAGCEMYCNQGFKNLICSDAVYNGYLYFYLKAKKDYLNALGRGATFKEISKKIVENIEIPLPEIPEQKRVAAILFKIDTIIQRKNSQLQKLEELVKSRFIEMFGDPITNQRKWEKKSLTLLGNCKNGMNFHQDEFGIKINCLGVGDFKNLDKITATNHLPLISLNDKPSKDYMLRDEDIVFVRSNGNKSLVGRCLVVYPKNIPTTFSGFCIRFRQQEPKLVNTEYLLAVLKTNGIRSQMAGRGANIQNLNQKILSNVEIPIPSMALQNQFADFVKSTEKSKLAIQKSLDELETLKKSLMQQYFG